MSQQIVAASVNRLLRHNVAPILGERFYRVRDRSSPRSQSQSRPSSFQCRHTLFQDLLCGICKAAIDISCVLQIETRCRVGAVLKHIGRRSVYRNRPRVRRRIRNLLTHMKLQGFKFKIC